MVLNTQWFPVNLFMEKESWALIICTWERVGKSKGKSDFNFTFFKNIHKNESDSLFFLS